jgi:hypothetical protein
MNSHNRRKAVVFVVLPVAVVFLGVFVWGRISDGQTGKAISVDSSFELEEQKRWTAIQDTLRSATAEEALALANRLRTDDPTVNTTLTAERVEFSFPDGRRVGVPVGASEMIVSIAPYRTQTHPCAIHSISGCQGEITDRPFEVTVIDLDGELVFTGTVTTGNNGFFEIPLPRNREFMVSVDSNLGRAERLISTSTDDPTCITDMKLL